jgi:uncharacterized membrane protein YgdD (TMEM256/DUF423 family)
MWILVGGISGFLAVALGAFGAHGLKTKLAGLEDGAARLAWWSTAAEYHLAHSLLLVLVGLLALQAQSPSAPLRLAGIAALVGVLLFSGSLYTMTLTGIRALGAVTPLGGLAFLVAWAAVGYAGWRLQG